jgi:UDP-N-acetylglucosamine/UDP-N-acetylgalactosamine 4-epimerase
MNLKEEFGVNYKWLITGVAGFIGSNILEYLLQHDQKVIGIDNFSTGAKENLAGVLNNCSEKQIKNFSFCDGDIRDFNKCSEVMAGVDIVLHQAALGSVPRSILQPELTHESNVDGMFNILHAAKNHQVKAVIYASSSSVYGDSEVLPKVENIIGKVLSPYAATKYINEVYADVFARCYGMNIIGLRYFNVFGPRQNKDGPYAAVIPIWIANMLNNEEIYINGDGSTSRDFTYISNVVLANIMAAKKALNNIGEHKVYNIAAEKRTSLRELYDLIINAICFPAKNKQLQPKFRDFRDGDIKHSFANIDLARRELGYDPICSVSDGIKLTVEWFKKA